MRASEVIADKKRLDGPLKHADNRGNGVIPDDELMQSIALPVWHLRYGHRSCHDNWRNSADYGQWLNEALTRQPKENAP